MKKSRKGSKEEEEVKGVEELLQAAADEMMLNLSVNSHMSRVSPNYVSSDLDRRFQALKSSKSSKSNPTNPSSAIVAASSSPSQSQPQSQDQSDPESTAVLGDDLSARFAALKASLSSSCSTPEVKCDQLDEDEDEDDEVEKLIRWAKDAARLDPSPPSDDEEDDDDDDKDDDDHHHHI